MGCVAKDSSFKAARGCHTRARPLTVALVTVPGTMIVSWLILVPRPVLTAGLSGWRLLGWRQGFSFIRFAQFCACELDLFRN